MRTFARRWIRVAVCAIGISPAVFPEADLNMSVFAREGNAMRQFANRDGRTRGVVVSGTQILFTSIGLMSAFSVIWVLLQRLLLSQ